jgi:hypothetical protein
MHYFVHWAQAAAEARSASEPHAVTYVDFLTVTLTAMCVLLAALGFIVAVVAIVGYRDIKSSATKAAKQAAETAIEARLKQYPDATEIHAKFSAMDRYMNEIFRKERLLSQVRAAPIQVANASKRVEDKPVKRPSRYPKKGD